ncbi:hypothetical protein QR46_2541 [Giardia duodenalis assemblage B]|uniref:Protein kish n=1 Tax=Giardia duodenalis assemblage B TaxID=1394984 RepID=A0A132NTT4_GIAIN|nr:hypothetical protein QR46_2541 [Giardia intestinalis assemblage B]
MLKKSFFIMTSVWCLDGFLIFAILFICCCSYVARMPRFKSIVFQQKTGFRGTLYKSAVIGLRLHYAISILCILLGVYRLLF